MCIYVEKMLRFSLLIFDSLETFGTAVQAIEDKTSALDKASDHHAKTVDQLMEQMMTIKQEATSRVNDSTADGDGVMVSDFSNELK